MKTPLWSTEDCALWARALADYSAALRRREVSRLPELDAWYRQELPSLIAARSPAHVTLDELVRVTEWKMKRGKWRARNLALVRGNPALTVEQVSRQAFAQAPDPRKPVAALATLDGVGPATASAVLAAAHPEIYPFFDEDVAALIPGLGEVAFTVPYYLRYADRLRARARALATACSDGDWTPHRVGLALWTVARSSPAE